MSRPAVLMIDDNAFAREQVRQVLDTEFDVVTAIDGASALRALSGRAFDAVVLALELGQESGRTVHGYLESVAPRLLDRVVLIGAGARDPELDAWARSFGNRYVRREDVFGLLDVVRDVVANAPL